MNTSFQRTTGTDEWYTPPEILQALGEFDLDPCAPERPICRTAKRMVDKNENGLKVERGGVRVWLNPPYSRPLFAQFCDKLMSNGNGIALVFGRTGNATFQKMLTEADAVLFLRHRVRFITHDGRRGAGAGCDSVLFAFGEDNVKALENSGMEGILLRLKGNTENMNQMLFEQL